MDINRVLKEHGVTHQMIATALGIDRITVTQTINKNPTIKTLRKYADIVGCRVVDFFVDELEEDEKNKPDLICPHCGKPLNIKIE